MSDKPIVLEIATLLKVKPKKAVKYLQVKLGDSVRKNQLLAQRKRFLCKAKKVYSPVNGVVEKLEEKSGCLFIKPRSFDKKKKPAFQTSNKIKGVFGSGYCRGKMIFLGKRAELEDLKDGLKDKIVAVEEVRSRGVVFKIAVLEAKGLLVGFMPWELLKEIRDIGEKIGISLLVLSEKNDKKAKILKENDNKEVVLDGRRKRLLIL